MSTSQQVRPLLDHGKELHALSCINCRQRKVKCSKIYPCPHCVRGGLECIFPSRKKERRPRTNKNRELLNRLAKLEAIVGQDSNSWNHGLVGSVDPTAAIEHIMLHPTITPAQEAANREHEKRNPQETRPTTQAVSREDPAAKYVSGEFWANLCREVEGIKATLEEPSDGEEEEDDDGGGNDGVAGDGTSPESGPQGYYYSSPSHLTSPVMFGNAHAANVASEGLPHPVPGRMRRLREIYFRNVDPLIKILHRPTIESTFDRFLETPVENTLSRTTEALFFAMYFAAVTSLSRESCMAQLGEERRLLTVQYKQAVELALAKADYLNNTSLESLQALMIYDTCLRNHGESRASWALFALVLRLGQAIGIHRDGDGSAFPPFEAEMRRRLWSQIIVLDVRAAQDRGTEPMCRQEGYNTLPPTNLNDDDFGPQTTAPLPRIARQGPTDVTFSLCTFHCSKLFLYIHGPSSRFPLSPTDSTTTTPSATGVHPQVSEEDLIQRIKTLETQFITPAALHPGHFPSALAAAVVRLVALICWLTIQYPFQVRQPTTRPRVSREHMLQTAISIIELQAFGPTLAAPAPASASGGISMDEYRERFIWWQDGYVQWHSLSVALAELCVQTEGPLVERAWRTVDRVLPLWSDKVADMKRGALWRPIRKLARRAREKRAEAVLRRLRISDGTGTGTGTGGHAAAQGKGQGQSPAQAQAQAWGQAPIQQAETETRAKASPNPATDTGPTGLPLAQDFGPMPAMSSGPSPGSVSSMPPALILQNDHNNQWPIDFTDIVMMDTSAPPQDLDLMQWSSWNDFVNEANFDVDYQSSSKSEGK